jgi:hypothetical protein
VTERDLAEQTLALAEATYRAAVLRHARAIIALDDARRTIEALDRREYDERMAAARG